MLTIADVLAHDHWLARRFDYLSPVSHHTVRSALEEAANLARSEDDEPAALFFVFARRPGELGDSWKELPHVLAKSQAHKGGLILHADREELRTLRFAIAVDRIPFEDVRDWFRARLKPRGE